MKNIIILICIICMSCERRVTDIKMGDLVNLEYMERYESSMSGGAVGILGTGVGTISGETKQIQYYRFYIKNMNGEIYLANVEPRYVSFIESDELSVCIRYNAFVDPKYGSHDDLRYILERRLREQTFEYDCHIVKVIFYIPTESIKQYIIL